MAGIHETLSRFDVSGEILSEDTILLLTQPDPKISGYDSEVEDCAAAFELLSEVWQEIRTEISEFDTEKLRKKWLTPVFDLLGHNLTFMRGHTDFGGRHPIPLTHRSHIEVPVWMLDYEQNVDEKPIEGKNRRSPHEHFQEYLDLTDEDAWGILTNGRTFRLLHDYHKSLTRNFVEVDLANVFESLDFDAFRAVWRIFHAKSFTPGSKGVLPIERLRDFSRQEGTEIGKELRFQVLECIKVLGNGFLQADVSGELAQALREQPNALMTFYRALLRIVYRLLFLLYIDNKPNWTPARDRVWSSSYSISRLKKEAEDAAAEDGKFFFARAHSEDHWEGLKVVFRVIREGSEAFNAKIHPYGGDLFAEESLWLLKDAPLYNQDLLKAIRLLTIFERKARGKKGQVYRVNFRNLRIDALGSVYEALLDIAPVLKQDGTFDFGDGAERKLSGTYYTPPALVAELIKSTLLPVIEDRLSNSTEGIREETLLGIKVVDPACGSGAFLIQAMDALAAKLCDIRYHGEPPTDEQLRAARRDVVTKCIHGVDLNPMAVELCKFTLWLHVAHPELPLSYLEPVIVCGNALVGVPLKAQVERAKATIQKEREVILADRNMPQKEKTKHLKRLQFIGWPDSIPDEAFSVATGDDVATAKEIKKRNKDERDATGSLFSAREQSHEQLRNMKYLRFKQVSEDTVESQQQKRRLYEDWRKDPDTQRRRFEADFWCAAFFWPLRATEKAVYERTDLPTQERFRDIKTQNLNAAEVNYWGDTLTLEVQRVAKNPIPGDPEESGLGFFHWEIEFPDVEAQGGFDCVIGNPPWERVKLQEREFFAERSPVIANAMNASARKRLIDEQRQIGSKLWLEYEQAAGNAERESSFLRTSGRYPLGGRGDVNTFAVFAELSRNLIAPKGRAGIIVPSGIATDDTTKFFFQDIVERCTLVSLFDFENGTLFEAVDSRFKFSLVTMSGFEAPVPAAEFAFFCHSPQDLTDPEKRFSLTPEDIALLNPNTKTCPVFRTRRDAEITKGIYRRVPVLIREGADDGNPWGISFGTMFHMSNDSGLFRTREQLESEGYELDLNVFVRGEEVFLPLYEAKMFHQFDHRFATGVPTEVNGESKVDFEELTAADKADPEQLCSGRYWVAMNEVLTRMPLNDATPPPPTNVYRIAIRDITRPTDFRTTICSILVNVSLANPPYIRWRHG